MKTYAVYRLGYWNNKLELMGKVGTPTRRERSRDGGSYGESGDAPQ